MTHIPDEIEAKFYPVNIENLRNKLIELGARCIVPMRLMKRAVFDHLDNPQLPVAYIRVRDEGNAITFSAKDYANEEKGHKHQRELLVNVNNFDPTVNLLKLIGLKQTNYQESKRETWVIGEAEVCIDIWPGLEPYIEVEASSLEEVEKISSSLPIKNSKRYEGGLLKVYMDVYLWDKQTALKKVKYLTFDHMEFDAKH